MSTLRSLIKKRQAALHKEIMEVLTEDPISMYRLQKMVGVSYATLTKFIVEPESNTLSMKSLLAFDRWLQWRKNNYKEFKEHLKTDEKSYKPKV